MMNTILSTNLEGLKNRFPDAFQKLAPLAEREILPSPFLASGEAPKAHAESFFLILGFGSGTLVSDMARLYPRGRLLVVESDPMRMLRAFAQADFTDLFKHPHLYFVLEPDVTALRKSYLEIFYNGYNSDYLSRLELIADAASIGDDGKYYQAAVESFNNSMAYFWNAVVSFTANDIPIGFMNLLKNIQQYQRFTDLGAHRGRFQGMQGIVASSGPSLTPNLPFLREIQDRVPIVCSDSSLRILLAAGIKPFGVACIERDHDTQTLFQGFDIPEDIVLFMTPEIRPGIAESFPGIICPIFRPTAPFWILPELFPRLYTGMSCAHEAYAALTYLGCREIALVGQDLAYNRFDGSSHMVGVLRYASDFEQKQKKIQVPDNQGGLIETNHIWHAFRDVFVAIQKQYGVPLVNVIAADAGLKIPEARHALPKDYFAELKALPKQNIGIDPTLGKNFREKMPGFFQQTVDTIDQALVGVTRLINELPSLQLLSASDYLMRERELLEGLPPLLYHLCREILKPINRRFNMLACSVWSPEEFKQEVPLQIEREVDLLRDFFGILTQGRKDLTALLARMNAAETGAASYV